MVILTNRKVNIYYIFELAYFGCTKKHIVATSLSVSELSHLLVGLRVEETVSQTHHNNTMKAGPFTPPLSTL
jgi:hypothetical protein